MRWNSKVAGLVFICSLVRLGFAQVAPELTSVPLQEVRSPRTPDEIRTGPPWRCDAEGRVYARVRSWRGLQVARFDVNAVPDRFFPSDAGTAALNNFRIVDFNIEPGGGIFALVVRRALSGGAQFRIAFIDSQGDFRNFVDPENLVPQKLAVFGNGDLLIAGFSTVASVTSSDTWFTGVFHPDGRLQAPLKLDIATVFSDPNKRDKQQATGVAVEDIGNWVDFISSPNGNVYAATIGSVDSPNLTAQNRILEISSSGVMRSYRIVDTAHAQLFHVVIGTNEILAFSGTKTGDDLNLRAYYLDHSMQSLLLTHRYRVLGMPQCLTADDLLVIRPDGKGHQYLVTYKR